VPFDRLKLIQCDTGVTPAQGTTSGTQSHPTNFNHANLALAGATAREALLQLAAPRLGAPVDQLVAKDGVISLRTDPSKKVGYGELVGGRKFSIQLNPNAKRKNPRDWTVLGTPVPRGNSGDGDRSVRVRAQRARAGMRHGRVVRPPAYGARSLVSTKPPSRDGRRRQVVVKKNFVGVVAEKPWQAIQAANKLKVTWTTGRDCRPEGYLRAAAQPEAHARYVPGELEGRRRQAARASDMVKATYHYPYQMHGSIGSACAVADVQGGKATIWSATQAVYPLRSTTAMMLGLQPADVHVIFKQASGCYGVNGADTVSYDAALMSQAVGKPVRVQLARKDEMSWENYGFAYVIDERVALNADGTIAAWDHESWSPSYGGRPGYNARQRRDRAAAGFEPQAFAPPAPDPANFAKQQRGPARRGGWGKSRAPERCQRTRADARRRVAVLHGSAALALASAEHVRQRIVHGRDRGACEGRSGRLSAEAHRRHAAERRRQGRGQGRELGHAPSPRPLARRTGVASGRGMSCVLWRATTATARWWPKSTSIRTLAVCW
jgi:hypothetical protein